MLRSEVIEHRCVYKSSIFCDFIVLARRNIYLESQHPGGLEKIRELEAQGRPAKLEIEEPAPVRPTLTDLTVIELQVLL